MQSVCLASFPAARQCFSGVCLASFPAARQCFSGVTIAKLLCRFHNIPQGFQTHGSINVHTSALRGLVQLLRKKSIGDLSSILASQCYCVVSLSAQEKPKNSNSTRSVLKMWNARRSENKWCHGQGAKNCCGCHEHWRGGQDGRLHCHWIGRSVHTCVFLFVFRRCRCRCSKRPRSNKC